MKTIIICNAFLSRVFNTAQFAHLQGWISVCVLIATFIHPQGATIGIQTY